MQSDGGGQKNISSILRLTAIALLAYGAVGVAVHLRLLPLVAASLSSWLRLPDAADAPTRWAILSLIETHFDSLPWLPWAAWLVGLALLARQAQISIAQDPSPPYNPPPYYAHWLIAPLVILLILLGGYTRMAELWPQSRGISQFPYDDEGVYAGTSQLFLQGSLPYRDYFFAHPPIAAISYAPAMAYHFTQWGSPTSFMLARYLSVVYSLITLLLIFFIGRQLAGLWGGAIAGLLWALDGRVIEINRKIMLDGPMVLLSCGALLAYLWVRPLLGQARGPALAMGVLKGLHEQTNPLTRVILSAAKNLVPRISARFTLTQTSWYTTRFFAALRMTRTKHLVYPLSSRLLGPVPTEANSRGPKKPLLVLLLTGTLAGMSALTKIAGAACLLAILVDLLWLHFDNRRSRTPRYPLRPQLVSLLAGAFAAFLLCVGPFLLIAPSQFVREVIFFQLLRPSDGLIDVSARIADLSATLGNSLTLIFAALGFAAISLWLIYNSKLKTMPLNEVKGQYPKLKTQNSKLKTPWRTIALWTFFSLLLFTYSRSFYGHYYIQLAAPLCLLGAGVGILPQLARNLFDTLGIGIEDQAHPLRWVSVLPLALLLVVTLPLVLVEWNGANSRHEDRIFEIVGRYVNDAVPPGTQVLATDEQFDFLAARPPSRNATGYLIDSYGHMIFLGLGLNTRDWGDLVRSALRGEHSNDAYAIMLRPTAQADILDRAMNAPLIVLHQKGEARLTQDTIAAIEAHTQATERQPRYTIYRNTKQGASK